MLLGQRRFSTKDQEHFRHLSGDANPIHMDPQAARRSVFGEVVVHGVHTTLWALDCLAQSELWPGEVTALDVRFPNPVYLGDLVTLTVKSQDADGIRIRAEVGGKLVATIRFGRASRPAEELSAADGLDDLAAVDSAKPHDFVDFEGMSGGVPFAVPAEEFAKDFPCAAKAVGAFRLRDIAAASCLVGMHCPGLRSVFARLSLEWTGQGQGSCLSYRVTATHADFNLLRLSCQGSGLMGEIEAFSPPQAPRQPGMEIIFAAVSSGEFASQTALVVGGSRGLGEVTAKIIAAGGGSVVITYARGQEDAARVAQEIQAFGGKADIAHYDIFGSSAEQLAALEPSFTHVYYFATCHISRKTTQVFEMARLEEFQKFYVAGFYELCQGLIETGRKGVKLFYPSSVFVEDRAKGFTEYAAAKMAGEILCTDLDRFLNGLSVHVARLPRVMSDQTYTVSGEEIPGALDILLPVLRRM